MRTWISMGRRRESMEREKGKGGGRRRGRGIGRRGERGRRGEGIGRVRVGKEERERGYMERER